MKFDEDIQDEKFEESNGDKIIAMLDKCEAFQLDECHIAGTASIKNLYKHLKNIHSFIGLSGTPFRTNEIDLEIISILGEKLIDISATFLIEKKVLPQPIIKFVSVPNLSVFGKTYHEVYKEYIVENDIRNNIILNQCKMLLEKKYCILVLFKTIAHGNILFDLFTKNGIKCGLLSGKDSLETRNEVIKQLDDNEINVIIASTIFDIGINVPKLSSLVLAGSGKSFVKILQRSGRLLRSYPGKTNVAIIDFYDNVRYLKGHSKERLETYQKEEGFKIIIPPSMK
jgi:superfamily II DNA or RNA helicase